MNFNEGSFSLSLTSFQYFSILLPCSPSILLTSFYHSPFFSLHTSNLLTSCYASSSNLLLLRISFPPPSDLLLWLLPQLKQFSISNIFMFFLENWTFFQYNQYVKRKFIENLLNENSWKNVLLSFEQHSSRKLNSCRILFKSWENIFTIFKIFFFYAFRSFLARTGRRTRLFQLLSNYKFKTF